MRLIYIVKSVCKNIRCALFLPPTYPEKISSGSERTSKQNLVSLFNDKVYTCMLYMLEYIMCLQWNQI